MEMQKSFLFTQISIQGPEIIIHKLNALYT